MYISPMYVYNKSSGHSTERKNNKQKTDLLEEKVANLTRELQTLVQRSVDILRVQGK